jgi:hypothetical protein
LRCAAPSGNFNDPGGKTTMPANPTFRIVLMIVGAAVACILLARLIVVVVDRVTA